MRVHYDEIELAGLNINGDQRFVSFENDLFFYKRIKSKGNWATRLKPINNYAISKLGGECAVRLYKNSLILRLAMTEKPFEYDMHFTILIQTLCFMKKL